MQVLRKFEWYPFLSSWVILKTYEPMLIVELRWYWSGTFSNLFWVRHSSYLVKTDAVVGSLKKQTSFAIKIGVPIVMKPQILDACYLFSWKTVVRFTCFPDFFYRIWRFFESIRKRFFPNVEPSLHLNVPRYLCWDIVMYNNHITMDPDRAAILTSSVEL